MGYREIHHLRGTTIGHDYFRMVLHNISIIYSRSCSAFETSRFHIAFFASDTPHWTAGEINAYHRCTQSCGLYIPVGLLWPLCFCDQPEPRAAEASAVPADDTGPRAGFLELMSAILKLLAGRPTDCHVPVPHLGVNRVDLGQVWAAGLRSDALFPLFAQGIPYPIAALCRPPITL